MIKGFHFNPSTFPFAIANRGNIPVLSPALWEEKDINIRVTIARIIAQIDLLVLDPSINSRSISLSQVPQRSFLN